HGLETSDGGIKDITWYTPQGTEMTTQQWQDRLARCIGVLFNGRANPAIGQDGIAVADDLLLIVMNSHSEEVDFTLPTLPGRREWLRVVETGGRDLAPGSETFPMGVAFPVSARALTLFAIPAAMAGEN